MCVRTAWYKDGMYKFKTRELTGEKGKNGRIEVEENILSCSIKEILSFPEKKYPEDIIDCHSYFLFWVPEKKIWVTFLCYRGCNPHSLEICCETSNPFILNGYPAPKKKDIKNAAKQGKLVRKLTNHHFEIFFPEE